MVNLIRYYDLFEYSIIFGLFKVSKVSLCQIADSEENIDKGEIHGVKSYPEMTIVCPVRSPWIFELKISLWWIISYDYDCMTFSFFSFTITKVFCKGALRIIFFAKEFRKLFPLPFRNIKTCNNRALIITVENFKDFIKSDFITF